MNCEDDVIGQILCTLNTLSPKARKGIGFGPITVVPENWGEDRCNVLPVQSKTILYPSKTVVFNGFRSWLFCPGLHCKAFVLRARNMFVLFPPYSQACLCVYP